MNVDVQEKVYAGVLGKIIGVYLGRPVEGWPYERIIETFGDVPYYVHEQCGMPLIVADDDISGTFGFFRTLLDHPGTDISAEAFGQTWLNYIIENRTILWWGGPGRSTEHTAWLNLRKGIPSPESGSMERNGRTLTEQIGAQIFIDAIAMASPGNPDRAADLVEKAARVSHDGIAVQAARHLAAMQALAFTETDLDTIFDKARAYVTDSLLLSVIDDVRKVCKSGASWREVRDYIELHHGYSVYPGPCHMVPNHAAVIACIELGGDDFQESIRLASSMGWDTDCNAGNVGAFNGIRLGLEGIDAGADFRGTVADRLLVITAAGGQTISDAVLEARKIIAASQKLDGATPSPASPRYLWEFPGSTQGWAPCPYSETMVARSSLGSLSPQHAANAALPEQGLQIHCERVAPGNPVEVSTPTFLDFTELAGNFSTIASPTLYEGQTVTYAAQAVGDGQVTVRPYILYYDKDNTVRREVGRARRLTEEVAENSWTVPGVAGMPIFRFGLQFESEKQFSGVVRVGFVDWKGAPERFAQTGMMMTSIWETLPHWTQMWCSSATNFAADFFHTLCISHLGDKGLATLGSPDWDDYAVSSKLEFSLHDEGGLVARAQGHRRYYALVLSAGNRASLIKRCDDQVTVLATADFTYDLDTLYELTLEVNGPHIRGIVEGAELLAVHDGTFGYGEAGFLMSNGSMTADGFVVQALGNTEI